MNPVLKALLALAIFGGVVLVADVLHPGPLAPGITASSR